ncbi:MAG: pilus assembly protein PilM [Lentisphaeria bacterium]|nr:pilus assembly protein PilM [Lentisphaeria bacterium]
MAAFGGKRSLGIDVGSSGVNAVALTLVRKEVQIEKLDTHDTGAEGILNDAELYASLGEWLTARKWAKRELVFGLPQFVCTTQVADFPAGSASGLEDMVSYETQQLAGLSEEGFIHDYAVMQALFGRKNPVLIGVCRESVVRERIAAISGAGVAPAALAMQGLAAVNALLWLQPEVVEEPTPQILLDLGKEGTTVAVVAAGQPLYVGSLDFGSYLYTRALAGKMKCDEGEAEIRKHQLDLTQEAPTSAVFQVTRKLETELQYAVEHWRAQERGELNEVPISGVWLCGGGARLGGLSEILESRLDCPVRLFGPTDSEGGQPMPEHVTAFGLALAGLGACTHGYFANPCGFSLESAARTPVPLSRRRRRLVHAADGSPC